MKDKGSAIHVVALAVGWLTFLLAYTGRQAIYSIFPILKSDLGFSNSQQVSHGIHIPLGVLVWFTGRHGGRSVSFASVAQWSVVIGV
jgi:hypothetical protein